PRAFPTRRSSDLHAALFQLLGQQGLAFGPDLFGPLGGAGQKAGVPLVEGVVFLDEVAHVDLALPVAGGKAVPCGGIHWSDSFQYVCLAVCVGTMSGKNVCCSSAQRALSMAGTPGRGSGRPIHWCLG